MLPNLEIKENELNYVSKEKKGFDRVTDVDNAYRITERLAFPRLIGSEGEIKAIETVVEEFERAGYTSINRQKFRTSFHNTIYSRYIFLILGAGLVLLALSLYTNPLITINWISSFPFI